MYVSSHFSSRSITTALFIALLLSGGTASAFSDDEARRAILELRAQVQQMREQNQQARLHLADQLDMLRQEVATLRGHIEELGARSRASASGGPTSDTSSGSVNDPQEQVAYEAAAEQYRNGRYKEAADAFTTFLESYPDSTLAGNAQFYLGSSQYASKDFSRSIQTMSDLVSERPDDPRAPDALLVMAADQIEVNDIKAAKASLERIIKAYPDSSAAETAKSRLKLL